MAKVPAILAGLRIRAAVRPSLELDVLVRGRPRIIGDEAEAGLGDAGAVALQERQLPDRQVHRLVVDELLDAVKDRFALLAVQLAGLLGEEPVDVRIASISVAPGRDGERLEPGGRIAVDA